MNQSWQDPGRLPHLGAKDLQVWRLRLHAADAPLQERHGLVRQSFAALTGEELKRAAQIRSAAMREEFIVGRGCLRRLLGAVLRKDPCAVVLEAGEHGKPRLLPDGIGFNVAHSHGMILIALAGAGEVGVDVEFMDAGVELLKIARGAFGADDVARIEAAANPDERLREFYRCWTRREAVTKADGRGLLLAPEELPAEERRYCVRALDVGLAYAAAVATSVEEMELRCFELSPRSPLLFAE